MLRQAAVPLALALAGAVVAVVSGGSTAGTATALALVGLAGVLALSLVFFAVGKSEDDERASARSMSRSAPEGNGHANGGGPSSQPPNDGETRGITEARRRRRPLPPRRPD